MLVVELDVGDAKLAKGFTSEDDAREWMKAASALEGKPNFAQQAQTMVETVGNEVRRAKAIDVVQQAGAISDVDDFLDLDRVTDRDITHRYLDRPAPGSASTELRVGSEGIDRVRY